MPLADNISFARFALGIEATELLIEPFLSRLARIDGAATRAAALLLSPALCHAQTLLAPARPKKRGPDQRAPVISRATAVSER